MNIYLFFFTEGGIATDLRDFALTKALHPISVTPSGITRFSTGFNKSVTTPLSSIFRISLFTATIDSFKNYALTLVKLHTL